MAHETLMAPWRKRTGRVFPQILVAASVAVVAGATIGLFATPYMGVATTAFALMVAGYALRRNPRSHVPLMVSAIGMDLGLVLVLEVQRDAVAKALSFTLGVLPQLHIACSASAAALYFPILALGLIRLKGYGGWRTRRAHLTLGTIAFALRALGFCFMFSLLLARHGGGS